jgi:hypothetical protein
MRLLSGFLLVLFALLTPLAFTGILPAKAPKERVLKHLVLYRFKEDLSRAQLQEVIDTFAGLASKVETIVALEHGANVSKEGKSEGLTYGFCVTFKDEAGLATYLKHPAHEHYVSVAKDKRDKVVVFDYWAER